MGFESFCQIFSYEFGDIVIMFNSFFFLSVVGQNGSKKILKKWVYVGNNYFLLKTIVLFSITTIVLTKKKFQEKQKRCHSFYSVV